MMKQSDPINRRQLLSLGSVLLLTPALRLFPGRAAELAGRAGWLTPLAALPLLAVYLLFLHRFLSSAGEGEGLAELAGRAGGEKAGKVLLVLTGLWLLFYCGFVLRSGADRFITTIYPDASPALFIVTMGLIGTLAALGPVRSLGRMACLVVPLLYGALALSVGTALFSIHREQLLPITARDLWPAAKGSLPTIDVVSLVLVLLCFFDGHVVTGEKRLGRGLLWLAAMCASLSLLAVAVIGSFGADLTAKLTRPYFYLVRNLVFFGSVERLEAFVVTLWVFPDFLMTAALLHAGQHCLRLAFGCAVPWQGETLHNLRRGRWVIPLCGAAVILVALLIAPDAKSLSFFSERLIPLANLAFSFLLLPGLYVLKGRKKGR